MRKRLTGRRRNQAGRARASWPIGALALLLGLSTAPAVFGVSTTVNQYGTYASWPTTWTPIYSLNDGTSAASSFFDFVGTTDYPGVLFAKDADYIYFRVRVNYQGTLTAYPDTGTTGKGTIMILINNDADDNPDYAFAWDFKEALIGHGLEMLEFNTTSGVWSGTKMDDVDGKNAEKVAPPDFAQTGTDGYIRTIDQQSTPWGYTTYVDFAIKCSYLTTLGSTYGSALSCADTNWKIQVGSISGANDHNFIDTDIAGGKSPSDTLASSWVQGTAVELLSFSGQVSGGLVSLRWETASETDNAGFHVWRADGLEAGYARLTPELIPAKGTATQGASYSFMDAAVSGGLTYYYRLEDVETNGTSTFHGPVAVTLGRIIPFSPPDGVRAAAGIPLWFDWEGGPFGSFRLEFSASDDFSTSVYAVPMTNGGAVSWIPATSYLPNPKEWKQIASLARSTGIVAWRVRGITLNGSEAVSTVRRIKFN